MGTLTFENVGKQLEAIIRSEFLSQLEKGKKRYYNEAQVQHKLGIELYKRFGIEPTLEWYVKNDESGAKEYIDMMLEIGSKKVAIELKYKTRKIDGKDYIMQGGQSDGKFHFFKDIERLERLKKSKDTDFRIDKGFAIFITNDHLYWNEARSNSKANKKNSVADFDLCDTKGIEKDRYCAEWRKTKKQKEQKELKEAKNATVTISRSHTVEWFPLSYETKKDGKTFRCLIIELHKDV